MASLETTQYVKPGDYVGALIRPTANNITGRPRLPLVVAKGSRLAKVKNTEIKRAYIDDVALTFTGTGPYTAALTYASDMNQGTSELVDGNGVIIPASRWLYVNSTSIRIPSQWYDASTTYTFSYQSTDRTYLDPLPINDLRQVERMGLSVDSDSFEEYVDVLFPSTIGAPAADAGNAYIDGDAFGSLTATDDVAEAVALVDGQPGEEITFVAATGGPAGNGIKVVFVADAALAIAENVGTKTVTINYITAVDTSTTIQAFLAGVGGIATITLLASSSGAGAHAWEAATEDQIVWTTTVDADAGNTGVGGGVYFGATSVYSHAYDRSYTIECVGAGTEADATFVWYSNNAALGNSAVGANPIHADLNAVATFRNYIDLAGGNTNLALEYGLSVSFEGLVALCFKVGDLFTFTARAAGLLEIDQRHSNPQFAAVSGVTATLQALSTGSMTSPKIGEDYLGTWNRTYVIKCFAVNAAIDASFRWTAYGPDGVVTGAANTVLPGGTITLDLGITVVVAFGATNFVVGDSFVLTVTSARQDVTIKDDRNYTFEVSTAVAGSVGFTFSTDTQEGGVGLVTLTTGTPYAQIPGELVIHGRNLAYPRYASSDVFTFALTLNDVVDWSPEVGLVETIDAGDVINDVIGAVTAVPNSYYVIVGNTPTSIQRVLTGAGATLAYTLITSGGSNTRYLLLTAGDPGDDVVVTYRHRGKEPNPGQTYRLSALYLRGADLYNDPILITNRQDGEDLLGPGGATNHAWIANQLVWSGYAPQGYFICQVADADDDGIYQDTDYEAALLATIEEGRITDVVVLDSWTTLGEQLDHLDTMADPFAAGFKRLGWFGTPVDTPIGDGATAGSMRYSAQQTLAVYGDNQSHGTRILLGSSWAKRTLVYDDKTTGEVTLDGSFVALAACMEQASFNRPANTILHRQITVFDSMEVHSTAEDKQLGGDQIIYIEAVDEANGIYRWGEDTTVDKADDEFAQIMSMTQKQHIWGRVSDAINAAIITLIPDDPESGAMAIRNVIAGVLSQTSTDGTVGKYLDESDQPRRFNAATDVKVFRDTTQKTLYRYFYAFWLKYVIKKTFGLAQVDSNDFGLGDEAG